MDNIIIYGIFAIVGIILLLNIFNILVNVFRNIFLKPKTVVPAKVEEVDPLQGEIQSELNKSLKPHLNSLEGMYAKSGTSESSFSAFVLSIFKDKFPTFREKNEELLESEICKCCGDYEGAECKESFCLEGSGISCPHN